jgi:serine/threonine protein phosphatase 1
MLSKLLSFGRAPPVHRVPDGLTVYAVGDIHGRLDLLQQVHRRIADDPGRGRKLVVYLGDYVDRGPQSREVIELLLQPAPDGWERVFLRGNHEQAMLDYLEDWQVARDWLGFGGEATLRSYGLRVPFTMDAATLVELQKEVALGVPMSHWAFMRMCALSHAVGDYLFVHAGIRPGTPWDRQLPEDVMWIREVFLNSRADHGKMVVHGHTICEGVEFRPNRIGIDTGAFMTGVLTCLVLEGTERRLIQT